MHFKNYLNARYLWSLYDINAKISSDQALRYAVSCAISVCISAFICQFLDFPIIVKLFFIFSSLVSVYYSYGNTLKQQSLMIAFGVLLFAFLSFIGVFICQYLWLAGIYLFVICLIGHFYAPINTGVLFLVKLGIVLLSFIVIGLPNHSVLLAWNVFWIQLFGGLIALFSNTIVYTLGSKKDYRYYTNQWLCELKFILRDFSKNKFNSKFDFTKRIIKLKKINEYIKTYSFSDDIKVLHDANAHAHLALVLDRITNSIAIIIEILNQNPEIYDSLSDIFDEIFVNLNKAIVKKDSKYVYYAYDLYRKDIFSKRRAGFFKKMDNDLRKSYVEFVYLFEKVAVEIISLLKIDINKNKNKNKNKNFKDILSLFNKCWLSIKSQKIIEIGSGLTVNSKYALRNAIAITGAFVFACFYGDPSYSPWIILSCDLVILVRQGDVIKKGFDRISGHAVGFGLALILGWWVWPYFSTGYVWVPVLILITSYFFLANYFYYSILLIIFIVYLYYLLFGENIPGFTGFPILGIALSRLIDVCIGTSIAILSGLLIFRHLGLWVFSKKDYESSLLLVEHLKCLAGVDREKSKNSYDNLNINLVNYINDSKAQVKSLSFHPIDYKKHFSLRENILGNQIRIFSYISSLTRRLMYSSVNLLDIYKDKDKDKDKGKDKDKKIKYFEMNPDLEKSFKKHISDTSNNLLLVMDMFWFPELSNKKINKKLVIDLLKKIKININKSILDAFAMSDDRTLSYDLLINYVSICIVLERINACLLDSVV